MGLFKTKAATERDDRYADLKRNVEMTAHKEDLNELLGRLSVNPDTGLSTADAQRLLLEYGHNILTPPKQVPAWVRFLKEISGFFALLLWAGAVLCFIGFILDGGTDNLYLGIVLVLVVLATGLFSFIQNNKSENLMNAFKNMMPPKVKVLRDGANDEVTAQNIVPGDIVFVEGGDLIPADIRVLECSDNFFVDNAALTGEAEPQKRKPVCTHDDPLETQNLCFFGTQVPEGSCKGIVIATGDRTIMGRTAALAMSTTNEQTPINKEIHHFIIVISGLAMFLGVLFFILNIIVGTPIIQNLVFMIGIIVANVPEGLIATVTLCLTLAAQRMHAKMVLVKNLEGVETLGSTSCICSDKTGTLTQNVMTVAQVVYGDNDTCVTKDAPSSFTGGRKSYDHDNKCFQSLLRCATLCNVATFNDSSKWELEADGATRKLDASGNPIPIPFHGYIIQGDGSKLETVFWKPVGNASECAMIKLVQAEANDETGEGDVDKTRAAFPMKFSIPFNSKNKYQVHIHEDIKTGKHILQMKGAPERILDRCTHVNFNGEVRPMTPAEKQNVEEQQEALSANGLRVLGFAEKELDPSMYNNHYKYCADDDEYSTPNFPLGEDPSDEADSLGRKQNPVCKEGLVFIGMMALIDPPRPAVPPAVEKCKTAGVKVIMVTGDHPITAQAIAYKVGILWSKTRGDMEKDNARFGRSPGDPDYENPDDALAIVVPGHTIPDDMSRERWDFILGHPQIVFARTSPQQKLVIVENNQRQGHIVAVTGDGVNDSPAIKKADIGIAMGIMGSEVSKNAADMILLDDNFASIVKGVEEGRIIFDNLKKSIAYTLQHIAPELVPFLGFIMFSIPLPLTLFLILGIDLGTDMIPAVSMAYESAEADIMMRPPRNSKTDRLVTKRLMCFSYGQIGVLQAIAGYFTYMVVLNDYGYPPNILIGTGSADYWGLQPFFCKVQGGNYVDVNGNINTELDPTVDPPTREFPFWFEGLTGYVKDCGYGVNNYKRGGTGPNFSKTNSSTYQGTNGENAGTIESYEANEQVNYIEYLPWKGRTSAFFQDKFLFWDSEDSNKALNLGDVSDLLYFDGGRMLGLWSLCAFVLTEADPDYDSLVGECGTVGGKFCDAGGVFDVRGATTPSAVTSVVPSTLSYTDCANEAGLFSDTQYGRAQFCNGQSSETEDGNTCQSVNGYAGNGTYFPTNKFQTFYCQGECGLLTDSPESLPICTQQGEQCGFYGENLDATCDYMCEGYCYWPGSGVKNANGEDVDVGAGFGQGVNGFRQCTNIASSEMAQEALKHAQTAYYISIVVSQLFAILGCKTRWLSLTSQGMKNDVMVYGMATAVLIVSYISYCIPINNGIGTRNIRLVHWFPAIPFGILGFIYEECRKALMRFTSPEKIDKLTGQATRKAGWLETNTYY